MQPYASTGGETHGNGTETTRPGMRADDGTDLWSVWSTGNRWNGESLLVQAGDWGIWSVRDRPGYGAEL